MNKARVKRIRKAFADACLSEGVETDFGMELMAVKVIKGINKDSVAGYKAEATKREQGQRA